MTKNWLEKNPTERQYFAENMLNLMLGLGYTATFEEAWQIVADDDLCNKYYEEADNRELEYQRGQMITIMQSILEKDRLRGQKNKFD